MKIIKELKSYGGIIGVSLFVLVVNLFFSNQTFSISQMEISNYLNPQKTADIIKVIGPVTQFIHEDIAQVEVALAVSQNDEYIVKSNVLVTEGTKLETAYTVQKGDTISGIASKFDLHVATILDRNNLQTSDIEKIHIGQQLIVPSKDTSTSQGWLAEINAKKEQERLAVAEKARQVAYAQRTVTSRDTSGYSGPSDGSWAVPISYKYISRGIISGVHYGIDMVASIGTPVYASKAGSVSGITYNWGGGYGNSIVLNHGAGQTSRYAHLSSFTVGVGEIVSQGQLIGYSGNTGWSTGPHLHFEARQNGTPFNPFN